MSTLREDMAERLAYVASEQPVDLDEIINQCARTALLDQKQRLLGFYPLLSNIAQALAVDEPDLSEIRTRTELAIKFIVAWDQNLASQA